mgnify:CR=1 FL=1
MSKKPHKGSYTSIQWCKWEMLVKFVCLYDNLVAFLLDWFVVLIMELVEKYVYGADVYDCGVVQGQGQCCTGGEEMRFVNLPVKL